MGEKKAKSLINTSDLVIISINGKLAAAKATKK